MLTNANFLPYCNHSGFFNMLAVLQKMFCRNKTVDESSNGSTSTPKKLSLPQLFGKNQLKFPDSLTKPCSIVSKASEKGDDDDDNRAKVVETRVALISSATCARRQRSTPALECETKFGAVRRNYCAETTRC